jgi:transcriptional regulator with XRE-family HTH domain
MVDQIVQCRGGSTLASEAGGRPLEVAWTATCPACGTVLELGYAGYLPAHQAVVASGPETAVPPGEASRSKVGERIRARREELGLSQAGLAGSGVSSTYVSLVERGKRNPSAKALRALAPFLGVSVHWLETGETDPAEELAQIVLSHLGDELTPLSRQLARRVLES